MTAAALNLRTDVEVLHRNEIFRKLGSFWQEKFEDHEVVKTLVGAMQDQFTTADVTLKEAIATQTSVAQAPLYHTEVWYRLFIRQADLTEEHPNAPYYSSQNGFYGQGWIYGQGVPTLWSWRVPQTLVNPNCIANALENPSWIGYANQAFYYSKGLLGFRLNPFLDTRFTIIETSQGPGIELWVYCSEWDIKTLGKQYGGPLGIPALTSTESYRKLCEGAWEARVKGPSDTALYKVIAGASGVPLCETEGEVVEVITTAPNGDQVVVTDRLAYRFPATHVVTVAVGQVLKEGQELTDALKVRHAASVRSGDDDITLPPGFLNQSMGIRGALRFPNRRVNVIPGGLDAAGNREISFELHGLGADLKRYRKAANAAQIYKLFDTRGPQALTVPTGAQIKANVNPAVELIAAHTKPHLVLLYGDPSRWPAAAEQQALLLTQADKILPAHGRLVLQPEPSSSASVSSQSYTSSSSSSRSRSESTWSTASSLSTASTSSTRSSRSSLSTASTATSASSRSSQSLSSHGTASSSSRSSQSLSSQSYSSRSTQSLSSLSSLSQSTRSTASTASTISTSSSLSSLSTISSQSLSSTSSYTVSLVTSSSSSSSTYALRSTSSVSSLSTLVPRSTSSQSSSNTSSSSSTLSSVSSVSLSSRSSQSPSSISLSSRTSVSMSTLSSRSESSISRSLVSSSSLSSKSESSRSSRTDSSQTLSSASSLVSLSSLSMSSVSDRTVVIVSLSTASTNSSSSTATYPTNCNKPMPYNSTAGTFTTNGFFDAVTNYGWIVKRFTNYTAAPVTIRVRFTNSSIGAGYFAIVTSNPCNNVSQVSPAYNSSPYDMFYTVAPGATIWGCNQNYYSGVGYMGYSASVTWLSSDRSSSSSEAQRSTSSNSSSSKSTKSGPPYGTQSVTSMSFSSASSASSRSTDPSAVSSSSSYLLWSTSSASSKSFRSSDSSLSPV